MVPEQPGLAEICYNESMKLYMTIDGTMIGFYGERGGEVRTVMYRDVYERVLVTKTRVEETWVISTEDFVYQLIPGFTDTRVIEREGYWEDRAVRIPEHQEEQLVEIPGFYEIRTITTPAHYETQSILTPEYTVTRYREIEGHYETESEYVNAHYETQNIWVPEYEVTRYREVMGHYETQNIWIPEHEVTKYYWREASAARGLEAAWIPYQEVVPGSYRDHRVWVDTFTEEYLETIPAGYKDQRVWVVGDYVDVEVWMDTYTESYEEVIPEGYKDQRVWVDEYSENMAYWVDTTWEYQMVTVPEAWGTDTIWIQPVSETITVDVPPKRVAIPIGEPAHWDYETIVYQVFEEVWVGYEPVYEYIDQTQVTLFEVLELDEGAGHWPDYEDIITIKNNLNGDVLTTSARYIGLAERIDENEFVMP